jgi:alpha-beta hydrolase superfamily lysophospholipase
MDIEEANWSPERDGEIFGLQIDDVRLEGCHWRGSERPCFVILFFHGLCSSVEYNANILREIPRHNGAVLAVDHIGHGFSPGFPASSKIEDIVLEARCLITYTRSLYPDIPLFLFGHSMGGLAVIDLALRGFPEVKSVDGVIAHAPWLTTAASRGPGFFKKLGIRAVAFVRPNHQVDSGLRPALSQYAQGYKDMICSSPRFNKMMTLGLISSVLREGAFCERNASSWPNLPLLFIQGMADNCVEPKQNVQWAENLKKCLESDVIEIEAFDNGQHNLFLAGTRRRAFERVLDFVKRIGEKKVSNRDESE